ncbi:MAG: hypothetical protein HOZ81_04420 [Streptomyces sp.]|nr:hypothetical protein [Streptomyces sp.]
MSRGRRCAPGSPPRRDGFGYVIAFAAPAVIVWGFPLITGVLVWVLAISNLIDSGMPKGPPFFQFCSLLGGSLSVTVALTDVSPWELHRMRTRLGVTVRG